MSSFIGLRVVRGPGWKWGDQDGGEGNAGTVVALSAATKLKPAKVTVLWDCGMKTDYQSNTDGSFELRIVSNMATGVKHPNIPCGADDCWVQEIRGIRWMCASCKINLCTSCFFKEKPHNKDHTQFKRYDTSQTKKPATVWSWSKDGPESRSKLLGIYPGAKVFMGPEWPYLKENERKIGLVIPDPKEELLGGVLVEWIVSKERSRHPRFEDNKLVLHVMENGIGGHYYINSLPTLNVPVSQPIESTTTAPPGVLSLGDRVQIDSSIQPEEFRMKQKDHGGYVEEMEKFIGRVGTIQKVYESSSVNVKFRGYDIDRTWRLNPAILKKLNIFSINQIIRIKNDEETIREISKLYTKFQVSGGDFVKLEGSIGRISGIDENDPDKLLVQLDADQIYRWLDKSFPLPSEWMEPFQAPHPEQDEELAELIVKQQALFFKAVGKGNLRVAKLLYHRHGVDVDAYKSNGRTALHVACKEGYVDLVEWLIDEAKADVEKATYNGFRAIHYAAHGCQPKVIQILIDRGAEIDSQTDFGRTALHLAVANQFTECVRLLIQRDCDVNIQDYSDGNTPLHEAIHCGRALLLIKLLASSGRNQWKLRNNAGFNVLHLAVIKDNHKAIGYILENEKEDLIFERVYPQFESNIFHYACFNRNYQVIKLLLDHQRLLDQRTDGSFRQQQLLEARYCTGATPLLIAILQKDYATITFLVAAGADVKSCDRDGNTAIMYAAFHSSEAGIPSKENSSAIFQLHNEKDPPLLSLIKYLILKGCCWTATNKDGDKASDILMDENGYSKEDMDSMDQFAIESLKRPANESSCIGQDGNCAQQPAFQLTCPHKPISKACSKCILVAFEKIKCGCTDESVSSIPEMPTAVKQEVVTVDSDEEGNGGPINAKFEFKWFSDSSKNGYVKDQLESKYTWYGTRKSDGGIGFRCTDGIELDKSSRCPAIVRRFVDDEDGSSTFLLETPHNQHGATVNKRERDDNPGQGGSSIEVPSAKRERIDDTDDGTN